MGNKWRPEGLVNKYTKIAEANGEEIENERVICNPTRSFFHVLEASAFESGVDALLEALREKGVHVDGDASFTSAGERWTLSNKDNTGTYTFIPDDTEASDGK